MGRDFAEGTQNPISFLLLLSNIGYASGLIRKEITAGSLTREYFAYIPQSYRPDLALPIAFVFHEGSGKDEQISTFSGLNKILLENGFLIMYPKTIHTDWNDERESDQFQEHSRAGNDVTWIKALLPKLITIYPVDTKRM